MKTLPTLAFDAPDNSPPETLLTLSIPENEQRDSLVLTADAENTSPVWLGGTVGEGMPIFPGDRVFIEGTNNVDFTALDAHTLYTSEIVFIEESTP